MGIRHASRWFGIIILTLEFGLFTFSGLPRTAEALVSSGALLVTGVLFALAGFESIITRRFGWHRVFGLGFVVMGISQLATALISIDGDGTVALVISGIAGAAIFGFIGFDIARDGRHFDVDPSETV